MPARQTSPPNLLVVAHPDDEAIFFSGLVMSDRKRTWHLVCVTDGNADGRGRERRGELAASCQKLGIQSYEHWNFPDVYEQRLPVAELRARLGKISAAAIFTHGILGEYGHPHHQDVSFAVHSAFARKPVWSVAYNCRPDRIVKLTPKQYAMKTKVLNETYGEEMRKFANLLPVTAIEEFVRLKMTEVEEIYSAILENRSPQARKLKTYRAWADILAETPYWKIKRLF